MYNNRVASGVCCHIKLHRITGCDRRQWMCVLKAKGVTAIHIRNATILTVGWTHSVASDGIRFLVSSPSPSPTAFFFLTTSTCGPNVLVLTIWQRHQTHARVQECHFCFVRFYISTDTHLSSSSAVWTNRPRSCAPFNRLRLEHRYHSEHVLWGSPYGICVVHKMSTQTCSLWFTLFYCSVNCIIDLFYWWGELTCKRTSSAAHTEL